MPEALLDPGVWFVSMVLVFTKQYVLKCEVITCEIQETLNTLGKVFIVVFLQRKEKRIKKQSFNTWNNSTMHSAG